MQRILCAYDDPGDIWEDAVVATAAGDNNAAAAIGNFTDILYVW